MRAADWIGQRIKRETDIAFGVTGGCVINAIDGLHKSGVRCIPMHHEQCAAMAADGYARMTGGLGVCYATSGPGGQNLLTGLASAYYDSIPVLALVGQVPSKQLQSSDKIDGLRQFGFQQSPNATMAGMVCKEAVTILSSKMLTSELNFLIYQALRPRRGPCAIDLCDDVQRANVEDKDYKAPAHYSLDRLNLLQPMHNAMKGSKRPILILGAGVTHSGCRDRIEAFANSLRMPVLLSWGGKDLLGEDNKYYVGGFGVTAERAGNWALKHSDLIVSIGCRLDTHSFGSNYEWLENKTMIVMDCDCSELNKFPNCVQVGMDIADLLLKNNDSYIDHDCDWSKWLSCIKDVRNRFPIASESQPHKLMRQLSDAAPANAIVVADTGQTLAWLFQSWQVKRGQRLFSDFNNSSMGYAIPAAIGAAFACPDRPVYCVIGDGGFMMNMQELQTIRQHNLDVRVIVVDNSGYGMIMQTQASWDTLSYGVSCNADHGVTFPDYRRVAAAFGIHYAEGIEGAMISTGFKYPCLIRFAVEYGTQLSPKLLWGDDLWNQKPYLSADDILWIEKTLGGCQ